MKIETENYTNYIERLPKTGRHIIAFQEDDLIVVYQAYHEKTVEFAIKNQILGGSRFSYERMSWIKPNFLWMMYRCGWAQKENQKRVIAIWLKKTDFENILEQAVFSSFNSKIYENENDWKHHLQKSNVRLQWDPDHDPFGNKVERKAIQLGLKGKALEEFGKRQIVKIEDVTEFVMEQHIFVVENKIEKLQVPKETIYKPSTVELASKIDISKD
jgi:Domain of unknown function (DUF4291)